MELKPSFHLRNQLSICWFSVLKFLAPKRNYWCYSRLHALIHDRNILYIQRVYMHHPPGRRSVSGTWGSLEATVSMAHAARRRGDPWSGSGAGLGETVIPRNIKSPRIDLLDSGVCWFITMLFNAVSTLMNDLSSPTTKGLTPVDRGIRPFIAYIFV